MFFYILALQGESNIPGWGCEAGRGDGSDWRDKKNYGVLVGDRLRVKERGNWSKKPSERSEGEAGGGAGVSKGWPRDLTPSQVVG